MATIMIAIVHVTSDKPKPVQLILVRKTEMLAIVATEIQPA